MKLKTKIKIILISLFSVGVVAIAANLTDIQIDAEGQKVISLYGNECIGNACATEYNDGVLTIPEEIICLYRQVWKPELVGLGNIRVEINDKKCIGNEEGRAVINGVFNLSIDPSSGKTIGKLWLDDVNSLIYENKNVTTYMRLSVDSSPSSTEPFGRFVLDVVDEDRANTQNPLFIAQVVAQGTTFKVVGRMANANFSGYADSTGRKGIYQFTGQPSTVLGYNNDQICFKKGSRTEDCFPRKLSASLTNEHVKVNAWAYGIYSENGNRYEEVTNNKFIRFTEDGIPKIYELFGGFGGTLRYVGAGQGQDPDYGSRPGGTSLVNGSDLAFWTNKLVNIDNTNGPATPVRLQWLTKTHSVHPDAAKSIDDPSINTTGISLDTTESVLLDPSNLNSSTAKSIGALPSEVLSAPLKVKAGSIL